MAFTKRVKVNLNTKEVTVMNNFRSTCKILILLTFFTGVGCRQGAHQKLPKRDIVTEKGTAYLEVSKVLLNRCVSCHSNFKNPAEVYSRAKDGKNSLIYQYVVDKFPREMPFPGSPQSAAITQEERDIIGEWILAGASMGSTEEREDVEEVSPEEKLIASCTSCHGENGISAGLSFPNLAGLNANYISKELKAIQSGLRDVPVMRALVDDLGEEDISIVSKYFSERSPEKPEEQYSPEEIKKIELGADLAQAKNCLSCHSNPVVAPNLFGQKVAYIQKQLGDFKSGQRTSVMMSSFAASLSEDDILNLAYFLNSQDFPEVNP